MRLPLILAALALWLAPLPAVAADYRVAFMPDVHFHDIYGQFSDGGFTGIPDPAGGKAATIRTMGAQLSSTRLFNENYFAFRAALDDAVKRGVTLIVLNGDFSDDGQPVHLRGLRDLLADYERRHGVRFFLTNGNHDPVQPVDVPDGKPDFLGADGKPQPVYSPGSKQCPVAAAPAPGVACSRDIANLGYAAILKMFADYGFSPRPTDLYWETPFYRPPGRFDVTAALAHAGVEARQYRLCDDTGTNCRDVTDSSYLVEPVSGLWLLALDANVYLPKADGSFRGSGDAGFNRLQAAKPHLLPWVADIVRRAKAEGKALMVFSHFPAIDTNNGTSPDLATLFGEEKLQLPRMPRDSASAALAATGVRFHVGGHMHYNDTALWRGPDGDFLVNIQSPSLAAYVPGYKLLTLHDGTMLEVETPRLADVPGFDALFGFYRREWQHLQQVGASTIWDAGILESQTYREFAEWHLRELARRRFLPRDWPADLRETLLAADAAALWKLTGQAADGGADWKGLDLATDFHRLLTAGDLALRDIPPTRLDSYRRLRAALAAPGMPDSPVAAALRQRLGLLLDVVDRLGHGLPTEHFRLSLTDGQLTDLTRRP